MKDVTGVLLTGFDHQRLDRAKLFSEYLDSQWELLPEHEISFQWPYVRSRIDRDIDWVTGKVARRQDIIERE